MKKILLLMFKRNGAATLLLFFIIGICFRSQAQVTVTVIIKPPYSSYLSEYGDLSNKVIITLKNTLARPFNVALHGQLKLNSTEYLYTDPVYRAPAPIVLGPNELKVITVDHQQMSFLKRSALISLLNPSVWQQIQETGILPEAYWELCVRALDYNDGTTLGREGCAYFSINRANAPVITSPFNNQTVPSKQPNIAFSWTPPIGNLTGAQLLYDLYVVKLMPDQNPNDAINAAVAYKANNPLVKTNLPANQYVTQPYDLKLDTGYTYAVQVVARDINKKIAFQNNGRSEVITFKYGSSSAGLPVIALLDPFIKQPEKSTANTFPVNNIDPVPVSVIKGKLYYKFKGAGTGTAQNSGPMISAGSAQGDGLVYNKDIISTSGGNPLSNVKVSLVVTYILDGDVNNDKYKKEPVSKSSFTEKNNKHFKDNEKVLATTTTAADGSFSFQFVNTQKGLGLTDANFKISLTSEISDHASGKLYKVIRLRVENKYYCSPDVNIKLLPWEGIDLGSVVSYVKSYNLAVTVKSTTAQFHDIQAGLGKPLEQVQTFLSRNTVPPFVPADEAGNKSKQSQGKVIAEKQTDGQGVVKFFNLVQHDPNNQLDRYYVKCETSKTKGLLVFKTKQKAYYPLWDKDKKNFPFNTIGQYMQSPAQGGLNLPVYFGENIVWNSQLEVKTYDYTMTLEPEKPRVFGKVYPFAMPDAKEMSDVVVMMLNKYKKAVTIDKIFTPVKTDGQGIYRFENLEMETGDLQIIKDGEGNLKQMSLPVVGPQRSLYTLPPGFSKFTKQIGLLKWGEQQEQNLPVTPDGILTGYVEDENGNAVAAEVIVEGLASTKTKLQFIYPANSENKNNGPGNYLLIPSGSRQVFSMEAPSGKNQKLVIDPSDSKYYTIDSMINIKKADGKTPALIKFVVLNAKKRVRFQVLEKVSTSKVVVPGSAKPVAGAKVKLDITGATVEQVSGTDGYVTFVFENMASSFSFLITAPANADLEEGVYQLNNVYDSKTIKTYQPAYLNRAATITGTVTLGAAKTKLADALVYIDLGNGNKLETNTGPDGKYVLKGVGKQTKKKTVWASKPGAVPNIISQSQSIELQSTNTLDFNLQTDNDIVIENIFGFTVDIQSKVKQADGNFLISGKLINLQANNNFKLKNSNQNIPFDSLIIKKSGASKNGIPVGVPANNSFFTDLAGIDLIVQDAFEAVQSPHENDRLVVVNENGTGKLVGKISIRKSSFTFTQKYFSFKNTANTVLSLTDQPGSTNTKLPGIIAGSMALQKYGVTGVNGNELEYSYIGFDSKADKSKSFLQGNDINLYTILNTGNIPGMIPSKLQIDIGAMVVHPNGIDVITGNKPLSFKLENWEFTAPKWTIQQTAGGIGIAAATIKTGVVDVPVTNVLIKPDDIDIGEFQLNNISFSGVVPLNINTVAKPVFGYNPVAGTDNKPHWELRIAGQSGEPGVTIQTLPGMKAGDEIKFQEFSLTSNGEQKITQGNQQQTVRFYNVMDVTPTAFSGGNGYFIMQTMADLNIPQLATTPAGLKFTKSSGQVKLEVLPMNVSLSGPGGVDFVANLLYDDKPLSLSNGKFMAKGTIIDKEGIVLKGTLNRSVTDAWVEVDPKNQKLPLGSGQTWLANIDGKMQADMNAFAWQKFSFSGDMYGFKGMQGNTRKTFIVNGSITADNEKIDVKNIPTAFGGLNITYDIKNARFTGSLQLDKQIGAMTLTGTADLLVDGGGWYFLAGGKVQTPGIGGLSAGLLIGNYNSMPQNVSAKLMQFAYDKNVPPGFKNGISGFFFTGMKELPVINIPSYSIDLGIISASFGVTAGLDARLWMGFDNAGNEYGIGAMAFAHAFLEGASITCTSFSAEARAELGLKGVYTSSNGAFSLKGCGSFTIGGSISQCVPTPCWDGICCEFCGGIGVTKGVKVDLLLDSNGNTDLSFGFGNCSGQNNMTGNW